MKRSTLSRIASISLAAVVIGCQSLKPKPNQNFISPLGSHATDASQPSGDTPKSERELCIRTADTVANSGHVTEAIALYEKADSLGTKGETLHTKLAPLYAQSGQFEKAIARYQTAIGEAPKDPDLVNNYAWTLIEAGRPNEALQLLQSATESFPTHKRLKATQAVAFYHQGDRTAALAHFEKLHGRSAAHHNLAILDIEAGNPQSANAELQRALQQSPSEETIKLAAAISETIR